MWALVPHDTGKEKMMERIGLTLDEYVDLKIKSWSGADRAFHEAAEMERQEMFPMTLFAALAPHSGQVPVVPVRSYAQYTHTPRRRHRRTGPRMK